MESWHWFLLGIMVALTPSLLVLALLLSKENGVDHDGHTHRDADEA